MTTSCRVRSTSPRSRLVNLTTGGSPTGKFLVDGSKVTFRPSYEDSSEGVSFGFEDSNTYSLVIAAAPGDSAVVRSRAGRPNTSRLSCTFETIGIRDYVPGPPAVTITPSEDNPPLERSFDVVLSFNDLVRSSQLLNPNGTSPTVSVSLVSIDGFGNEVVFPLDGTFLFQNDIDNRTTSLTFQPLGALPTGQNGTRWVRIDVSNQITDLVGNRLVNSGSFKVPLPEVSGATGSISEDFATTAKLDPLKSAPTLWEGTGFLDSGLDPVSGQHPGGGSGVFGSPDLDGFVFDTGAAPAAGMVHSELLGIDLPVSDGVMMFSSLELGFGDETAAMGTRPLRLFVRGSADIRGTLDFSGADGETNFGMYRPDDERLSYNKLNGAPEPPTAEMQALLGDPLENLGGAGGEAALGGGGGGHGGLGWHQLPGYYNDAKDGYFGEHSTTGPAADDTRYLAGYGAEPAVGVHGQNGGRVGGQDAQGAPLGAAAAQIIPDALEGSGMGTWAWPPKSKPLADCRPGRFGRLGDRPGRPRHLRQLLVEVRFQHLLLSQLLDRARARRRRWRLLDRRRARRCPRRGQHRDRQLQRVPVGQRAQLRPLQHRAGRQPPLERRSSARWRRLGPRRPRELARLRALGQPGQQRGRRGHWRSVHPAGGGQTLSRTSPSIRRRVICAEARVAVALATRSTVPLTSS